MECESLSPEATSAALATVKLFVARSAVVKPHRTPNLVESVEGFSAPNSQWADFRILGSLTLGEICFTFLEKPALTW